MKPPHLLTLQDRRSIKYMLDAGKTPSHIAKELGRVESTVMKEIYYGIKNGAYDPEFSDAFANEKLRLKGERLIKHNRGVYTSKMLELEKRIESLEAILQR